MRRGLEDRGLRTYDPYAKAFNDSRREPRSFGGLVYALGDEDWEDDVVEVAAKTEGP